SVESYSIKRLEPLYGFARNAALPEVGKSMARLQACLELDDVGGIAAEDSALVQAYNEDDCRSTRALRDWLETVRARLVAEGADIPRPGPPAYEVPEEQSERQRTFANLRERLTAGISLEPGERSAEEQARWLLGNVLEWHRREDKAAWWEYFRLSALSDEELLDEKPALSGLAFVEAVEGAGRLPVHRYRFPLQDTDIRDGEGLRSQGGEKVGGVAAIQVEDRTIDIKKRKDTAAFHPTAIFSHQVIRTDVLADALFRIGEHVAHAGIAGPGPFAAA